MKPRLLLLLTTSFIPFFIAAQVTGKWKTVDDTDGQDKSIVEIYEQGNKLFGRVIELLPAADIMECEKCTGDLKNKPIKGMVILKDLERTPNGGEDGKILDPASGKIYSCYIELVSADKLKLRGYLGLAMIGRTQYWYRIK